MFFPGVGNRGLGQAVATHMFRARLSVAHFAMLA